MIEQKECKRCGHKWMPRIEDPIQCPRCMNRNWKYERVIRSSPKSKAYQIVKLAIDNGTIIKPLACQRCNKENIPIEAHHEDYNKPLDVMWVCSQCHTAIHKEKDSFPGVELTCGSCGYSWIYRGQSMFYSSCPRCHSSVRVNKEQSSIHCLAHQ